MNSLSPTPARPGRPKSDAKRRAILCASGEMFLRHGYRDTTMDGVAARAGVSKQTVYSHFSNKEELLRACVYDKVTEYGLELSGLPADLPLDDALRRVGRQFMRLLGDEGVLRMYRLLISESLAHPNLSRIFYEAGPRPTRDSLAAFLRRHPQGARFAAPAADAELFFVLLEHTHFMHRLLNLRGALSADETAAHVERAVGQFLRLCPPPREA